MTLSKNTMFNETIMEIFSDLIINETFNEERTDYYSDLIKEYNV